MTIGYWLLSDVRNNSQPAVPPLPPPSSRQPFPPPRYNKNQSQRSPRIQCLFCSPSNIRSSARFHVQFSVDEAIQHASRIGGFIQLYVYLYRDKCMQMLVLRCKCEPVDVPRVTNCKISTCAFDGICSFISIVNCVRFHRVYCKVQASHTCQRQSIMLHFNPKCYRSQLIKSSIIHVTRILRHLVIAVFQPLAALL